MNTIIESVKGIIKLEINEKDFNLYCNEKTIAIYGANGAGKSSFKDAISLEKPSKNWGSNKNPLVISEIKLSNNGIAIFDEQFVKVVRGINQTNIQFLGREITTLFELLTNRENTIKEVNKILPGFETVFDIKEDTFKFLRNILNETRDVALQMKAIILDLKSGNKYITISDQINQINSRISSIENSLYSVSGNVIYNRERDYLRSRIINEELGILNKKVNKKNLNVTDILNLIGAIDNVNKFNDLIYDIQHNFGYLNPENTLIELIEILKKIKLQPENLKTPFLQTLPIKQDDIINQINKLWSDNAYEVSNVVEKTNEFLDIYNLGYSIKLNRTTVMSSSKNQTNFGLIHIPSGEILSVMNIEESVSFGELNIISVSIFVAVIISRNESSKINIIFDDPVSSYDLNRVHISLNLIKNWLIDAEWVNKIIFMSHEKHFIKLVNEINKNTTVFNLIKGDTSILKHINKINSDLDFVKKVMNDEINHILARATAKRQFYEVKKIVSAGNKYSTEFNLLSDIIHRKPFNEKHAKLFGITVDDLDKKIQQKPDFERKENFLALRAWIQVKTPDFFKKIKKQNANPHFMGQQQITNSQALALEFVLDGISHFSESNLNADISRLDETVDVVHANRKKILRILKIT